MDRAVNKYESYYIYFFGKWSQIKPIIIFTWFVDFKFNILIILLIKL